jgi:hypothetical protein
MEAHKDQILDAVYIEHCINCKEHAWCTNHDESKYAFYGTKGTALLLTPSEEGGAQVLPEV